jgi:predicted ATPase
MIRELHLRNFKCFEDQKIRLRPLTLLTGLNGTGKSSVLQSLLLLRQSYQQGLLPAIALALNGELVSIGAGRDVLFEGTKLLDRGKRVGLCFSE